MSAVHASHTERHRTYIVVPFLSIVQLEYESGGIVSVRGAEIYNA